MKILHAASECHPLIKTGGLADVLGALPQAQQQNGDDVRLILPYYSAIAKQLPDALPLINMQSPFGEVLVRRASYRNIVLYLIDVPSLYAREGNIYYDRNYQDYSDNLQRFATLSWTAAALACGADASWGNADILHCHDWQTGLAPAYLTAWGRTDIRTLFTIHNIAYQGLFPASHFAAVALPARFFNIEGAEFYGQFSFLKTGLYYANHISTVSPTYAREITESAEAGCGMQGLLATRAQEGRLHGILNGVDEAIWHPATDTNISHTYSMSKMAGKAKCKTALQKLQNLPTDTKQPLIAVVTRLTEQKGADFIAYTIENQLNNSGKLNYQFILLGSGEKHLEDWFHYLQSRDPEHIAITIGYNETLAHQIIAGADAILVPSRFEPCGLTQLYGLAYGTLPLVRRTGGLADTVTDSHEINATGFVFDAPTVSAYQEALTRLIMSYEQSNTWQIMQKNAMQENHGWDKVARQYREIYIRL